jgi:hypothetical protein
MSEQTKMPKFEIVGPSCPVKTCKGKMVPTIKLKEGGKWIKQCTQCGLEQDWDQS